MKSLVIWGAGGHGRVVFDIARAMGAFDDIVFFDDQPGPERRIGGVKVLAGRIEDAKPGGTAGFVIAIGSNRIRAERFAEALQAGYLPATCVHPTAVISPSATIGEGTVVMPHAVIQAGARIGIDCIINTAAIVEHDCLIGAHSHLSPSAALGGGVEVGEYVHFGIGGIAIPGARVGSGAIIGAGGVVLGVVPAGATFAGVPARRVIKRTPGK